MPMTLRTRPHYALMAGALLALAMTWLGFRWMARHILGPLGCEVFIADNTGATFDVRRAPVLFTPESLPGPPPGGSLRARGSFVARTSGIYTWKLGATSRAVLLVDGKQV